MQKALNHQMNVQLHHVISDLTRATGLAILDTILAGERNPETLAKLRDRRIRASAQTVAKSLVGVYRPESLFTLRKSLAGYRHCQQLIAECDREIERQLAEFESQGEPPEAVQKSGCGRRAEQNLAREHLAHLRSGPDGHSRYPLADQPGPAGGGGSGLVKVPQRIRLCLLAGAVPAQRNQRRPGAIEPNS
jgi:hypothetical protein